MSAVLLAASVFAKATPFQDGETVVFLGDSITQQARYTRFITDFYFVCHPDRNIRFVNAGIAGNSTGGALACLKDDVDPWRPTTVSIMFGMNDASADGK